MADFHDEVRQNIETMPVQVVRLIGTERYRNLAEAKRMYPTLDPFHNGSQFTWAMRDEVEGKPAMRFEDWETYRVMST